MRVIAFMLLASPAAAWDFAPGIPCVLTHTTATETIRLTYDPTQPLYTLTISGQNPWPQNTVFSMRFDGPSGLVISTDKHRISSDGLSLSVSDTGFGNVLDGLQFNHTATALIGNAQATFPLVGAAEPVAAFRTCAPVAGA